MITIENPHRHWMQCASCRTESNVVNVRIHHTDTQLSSLRLCMDCIKEIGDKAKKHIEENEK